VTASQDAAGNGRSSRGRALGPASGRVLQTLTPAECYDLLSPGGLGRVVFSTLDGPVALPVNFAMVGRTVVLRTGVDTQLASHLDCKAGFEADRLDETLSEGWSVLVTGHAVRVKKEEQVRHLEMAAHLQPWAGGARDVYVQIMPLRISGRRIRH
jgi:nitroimidazol reductase NimA-like FMN-containing flavoprotein (pyridoxamine 5'-phosphate oxidase superfamily)